MVDYSKWDNLEISEEEDETQVCECFLCLHKIKVERMEKQAKEKDEFEKYKKRIVEELLDIASQVGKVKKEDGSLDELLARLNVLSEGQKEEKKEDDSRVESEAHLKSERQKLEKKEDELKQKEKVTPWNVDTIHKLGFENNLTIKPGEVKVELLSEKERRVLAFIKQNEELLHEFAMQLKLYDSLRFLDKHPQLICEETRIYLVSLCIISEILDEQIMSHFATRQLVYIMYILEMSKKFRLDPRACALLFFLKIQEGEPQFKQEYSDNLNKVEAKVKEFKESVLKNMEEEKQALFGPDGLDPLKVFDSLPPILQQSFLKCDISMFEEAMTKMPYEESAYHLKRFYYSGLLKSPFCVVKKKAA